MITHSAADGISMISGLFWWDMHLHATPNTAVFTTKSSIYGHFAIPDFCTFHLPSPQRRLIRHGIIITKNLQIWQMRQYLLAAHSINRKWHDCARSIHEWQKSSKKIDFAELQHDLLLQAERLQRSQFPTSAKFFHYASYLICEATEQYRRHFLEHVHADYFHVFGDKDWEKTSPVKLPASNNLMAAPHIQRMAKINLCLSSQQLGSAVSLRAYEIPSGGFFCSRIGKMIWQICSPRTKLSASAASMKWTIKLIFLPTPSRKTNRWFAKPANGWSTSTRCSTASKMLAIAAKIEW